MRRHVMLLAIALAQSSAALMNAHAAADEGEIAFTCRIVEVMRSAETGTLTFTLCVDDKPGCSNEAGRFCAIGIGKETIAKSCTWVPKSQCQPGSEHHLLQAD